MTPTSDNPDRALLLQLAYALSHDVSPSVRHIEGFASYLQEEPNLPASAQVFLHRMTQSAQRMGQMLESVVTLLRLDQARERDGSLTRQMTSMDHLVQTAWQELQERATWEPDYALRLGLKTVDGQAHPNQPTLALSPLPAASVAPALMKQLWYLLIENAIKFSQHASDRRIVIGPIQSPSCQRIGYEIRDAGCGFDTTYQDRLFQPFQRLHRETEYPGLGMGLAQVQRILQLHGGEIAASSMPGAGARFRFLLEPMAS